MPAIEGAVHEEQKGKTGKREDSAVSEQLIAYDEARVDYLYRFSFDALPERPDQSESLEGKGTLLRLSANPAG